MKHYVICRGGKIVEVDAPANTNYEKIINIAFEENGDVLPIEVVSKKWVSLFKQYNKLYKKCDELDLFDGNDLYREINGYDITENCLYIYGKVRLNDYDDTTISIYYLNEHEFWKVVDMLDTLVKSAK